MPRVRRVIPDENTLLCETCGYNLSGIPRNGNCPECGTPIAESIGTHRHLSQFEQNPRVGTLLHDLFLTLAHPKQFYRTLVTRTETVASRHFAWVNVLLASMLVAAAVAGHFEWAVADVLPVSMSGMVAYLVAVPAVFLCFQGIARLATWLSAIEAKYWGMRLPHQVVRRAMLFHRAHYLPVGIVAAVVVCGYQLLLHARVLDRTYDTFYLYALSGTVIISAIYLFQTYWIAMRAMMYANR